MREPQAHQWKIEFIDSEGNHSLSSTVDFGPAIGTARQAAECLGGLCKKNFVKGHAFEFNHMK